jgi:hypothetical protein
MNRDALDLFVAGIDEEDAFQLLHAMRRKFDWAGSMWTPDDIRACIKDNYADSITWDEDGLEEFVSECVNTRWWQKSLDEITTEHGWEVLGIMVEEALNEQVQS